MNKFTKTLAFGAGAVGALALANELIGARSAPPSFQLGGVFSRYPFRFGDVAYTVAGSGTPVLLLHGLGAGNSMDEWRANFDALRAHHTVYAMDFSGWGLSDKPHHQSSPHDMVEQIRFFLDDVVRQPCALIASSDACAYAIEAAKLLPERVSKLMLICPPTAPDNDASAPHETFLRGALQKLVSLPVLGQTVVNIIASRKGIESFAERHLYFEKSRVDERTVSRYYASAHQPDVKYALASFITGSLAHDAREAWSSLTQPALLVWGRNARINPLETAPEWLALKPDARLEVIDNAMLLPHLEHAAQFNALALEWLRQDVVPAK